MKDSYYLKDLIECIYELIDKQDDLKKVAQTLYDSNMQYGSNIFICGNGGSSATASHFTNDLQKICRFKTHCLSDNTPLLTAWANDISYDVIFDKQLEILGNKQDILIVISGSGNSTNILYALRRANRIGMYTIAFVGMDGGMITEHKLADTIIHVPTDMLHSEDCHLIICHYLVDYIRDMK